MNPAILTHLIAAAIGSGLTCLAVIAVIAKTAPPAERPAIWAAFWRGFRRPYGWTEQQKENGHE